MFDSPLTRRAAQASLLRAVALVLFSGLLLATLLAVPATAADRPVGTTAADPAASRAAWRWPSAGFAGRPVDVLTAGITNYSYYTWAPACDYPDRHQIPMIWGAHDFYERPATLDALFNGPCNDGRPLLFLNEPAMVEQANVSPSDAADMFYEMTRGADWPRGRWRGQIVAGNNLIEHQQWDSDFVAAFAAKYNRGSKRIPEIAGWAVHVYGNFQYAPGIFFWNNDVPLSEVPRTVSASMALVDQYIAARRLERNSTALVATEFGYLHDRGFENSGAPPYETIVAFMEEYVARFRGLRQMQSWFWFLSTDPESRRFDMDFLVEQDGRLTPNGLRWRELVSPQQLYGAERPAGASPRLAP